VVADVIFSINTVLPHCERMAHSGVENVGLIELFEALQRSA